MEVSRHDYLLFQVESFLFRVTSVSDRALRLVDAVHMLGLPERACSVESVTKNSHVARTSVAKLLQRVDKLVEPYRAPRNMIAHARGYRDRDLDLTGMLAIMDRSGESVDVSSLRWLAPAAKREADAFVKKERSEFTSVLNELNNCVVELFDALEPVFSRLYRDASAPPRS
jgi:hypothetical protein